MAVFRIEKTQNYTVMSNHHLRNMDLSLKSKGLLSMMLSLPEDWNYTTRGLAKICKEGTDSNCLPGAVVKGKIYGSGVYQKGEVMDTRAFQEAYQLGKKV